MGLDFQQIQELIKQLNESNISEFKIKDDNFKLSIRTKHYSEAKSMPLVAAPMQQPMAAPPIAPVIPPPATTEPVAKSTDASSETASSSLGANQHVFKSPMIGTFYRSPGPDKEPFIKVGDSIKKGSVLCIVEAMKLFNEIESEVSGTIIEVLAKDNSPVEYEQDLFIIELSE